MSNEHDVPSERELKFLFEADDPALDEEEIPVEPPGDDPELADIEDEDIFENSNDENDLEDDWGDPDPYGDLNERDY